LHPKEDLLISALKYIGGYIFVVGLEVVSIKMMEEQCSTKHEY
jgi:hypothetical protein